MLSYFDTVDEFRITSSLPNFNYLGVDIKVTLEMIEDEQAIPLLRKTEKAIQDLIGIIQTKGGPGSLPG